MTRREFLAVAAASAGALDAWPVFAAEDADLSLRMLLDGFSDDMAPADKLRLLEAIAPANLSPAAQIDRDVVLAGLRVDAALAARLPWLRGAVGLYPVSPFSGSWRKAAAANADPALAEHIAAETEAIRVAAASGVILPRALLNRTIASVQDAATGAAPALSNALWRQCAQLLACRDQAPQEPGLWRLPGGEDIYATMLERQFGGRVLPADVHARLLERARDVGSQLDALLRKQGLNRGSIGERLRVFARQPRWLYSDDDAGRDRAVADMNDRLDAVRRRLPALFGPLPAGADRLRVRRMSAAEDAAGRSGYRALPEAGQDGAYVVDLRDIGRRPMWSLPSVVHHELLPGHMMMIFAETKSGAHPLRGRYAPAMPEGWAVYGEQLAAENGAFDGDEPGLIGYLHWLMFRLCRGMIDTGIHHARRSVIESRRMLDLMQGEPAYFAGFDQDIDQACINPGARAAEALSWLELAELRRKSAPGGDVRRFHNAVLQPGIMPFPMLAARLGKP